MITGSTKYGLKHDNADYIEFCQLKIIRWLLSRKGRANGQKVISSDY